MKQVRIADGRGERRETLAGIAVKTSGGVPPAWAALARLLSSRGRILDYGSWQGLAALGLQAAQGPGQILFAHTSSARLAQVRGNAGASGLDLPCQAMFPLEGSWDTIILTAPEQNEALAMMAAQAAVVLESRGQVLVMDSQMREDILAQHFGAVSVVDRDVKWAILSCRQPRPGADCLPWQKVPVQLGEVELELVSLPGNFSPRGLDAGTRAMLEEAEIPPGGRVLDLACGYGVAGIAASRLGAGEVAYIDEDLAALEACKINLHSLGLEGELFHSHLPQAVPGNFDCILTNPPYHTEYKVAKSFLEFAARRLNPGGWLWLVVKKPHWYINKLRTLFGGCRAVERDGYHVLSAQQRIQGQKEKGAKTTRKHRRRQQAARRRRDG